MTVKTFNYTGNVQTYTVPAGVVSVVIQLKGGPGAPWGTANGGSAAIIQGTLAVTPGEVLNVYVGGGGQNGPGANQPSPGYGGFNGGGAGGPTVGQAGFAPGNGGGGASDVRQGGTALNQRVIISGGGGAGSAGPNNGGGGGSLGGSGGTGAGINGGTGGSQVAGGTGGGTAGQNGSPGIGGNAPGNSVFDGPGGAGGGLYGGGSGGYSSGGSNNSAGGGGSSYAGGCTSTSTVTGGTNGGNPFQNNNSDAYVTITTVDTAPNAPTITAPPIGGFTDAENAIVSWTFSDPDAGDLQSSADIRYRVAANNNTNDWTTLMFVVAGTTSSYAIPGLTVGVYYELQVRTYDLQGTVGPWSGSTFFTAKVHPVVTVISPTPGQAILTLAGTPFTVQLVKDQYTLNFQRVADLNGQPDTSNVIETHLLGSASVNSWTFTASTHTEGPEHWRVQAQTFAGQVTSDWVDIPVMMSTNAPITPTCAVTAQPNNGLIQVVATFAEGSVDYFIDNASLPTVADTGQALTTVGSPLVNAAGTIGYLYNGATLFSQAMTLANKVLSMHCTFRQNVLGASHTNSIYLIATDASNNAHIYCGIDAGHWFIKKNVAGTLTTLATGALLNTITTALLNAYPYSMSVFIAGTTVFFTDPWGNQHTATDAVIGSFTGKIAKVQVDNSGATNDTWKVAHWSASSAGVNEPAVYGFISRSDDGLVYTKIPGSEWDAGETGGVFTYNDRAARFNRPQYYQVTSSTAPGSIARSVTP